MSTIKKFLLLGFLCIAWGSTWVAIKITLEGFPPLLAATARFTVAIVALYIYIKRKGFPLKPTAYEFRILIISAFLVYVLDYGLIYWGELYISPGVTSIFFATFAMFTALMSNFVFKNEQFQLKKFAGLLVGLLGILLVFYDQLIITQFKTMVILASAGILVAALAAAISMVVIKKFLPHMNTVTLSFHQTVIGTIFLLILGLIFEDPGKINISTRVVIAIVYMGTIASAVAFVLYYKLLKEMSAISLSLIIYIIPLIALITDYLFFGELISLRAVIGMLIIFTGIWLSRERRKAA